ncbi:hypothetical protein pb186bvf_014928 [Paramecium bursaria]
MDIYDQEIQAMKELSSEFQFDTLDVSGIQSKLEKEKSNKQKALIQQLFDHEKETAEVVQQIDKLELQYQELEGVLDAHQELLKAISRGTQDLSDMMSVHQTRLQNERKLREFIQK